MLCVASRQKTGLQSEINSQHCKYLLKFFAKTVPQTSSCVLYTVFVLLVFHICENILRETMDKNAQYLFNKIQQTTQFF